MAICTIGLPIKLIKIKHQRIDLLRFTFEVHLQNWFIVAIQNRVICTENHIIKQPQRKFMFDDPNSTNNILPVRDQGFFFFIVARALKDKLDFLRSSTHLGSQQNTQSILRLESVQELTQN